MGLKTTINLSQKKKDSHLLLLALGITTLLLFFARLAISRDFRSQLLLPTPQKTVPPPKNAAVILDTRPLEKLVPLILHFATVLGPQWPIHIFTSPINEKAFTQSPSFVRQLNAGNIIFHDLAPGMPSDFPFHEPGFRAQFMTQKWLWEILAPAEYVFTFTAESMVCSKSDKSLEGFLDWDMIGAPMGTKLGAESGVMGGLSIRNRQRMLEIVRNGRWEAEKKGGRENDGRAKVVREEEWFWKKLKLFPVSGDGTERSKLPSAEAAGRFAVGPVWVDEPFGFESVHVWQEDAMDRVLRWCPEYVISMFNMTS
jgi:hypothetical protein